MKTTSFGLAVLVLACVLPGSGATHGAGEQSGRLDPSAVVIAFFEFDQTAAHPPADLEGILVLESRSEPVNVNGSVVLGGRTQLEVSGSSPQENEALVNVDINLEPFTEIRIPFSVPIRGLGLGIVEFEAEVEFEPGLEDGERLRADQSLVYGVAPVQVSLDSPAPDARLVSVPGRPAELVVTLTALPGSNLTNLRLTQEGNIDATEAVEVGNLTPGESFTATLALPADVFGSLRFRSVRHASIIPQLHGFSDGEDFSHSLYRSDGNRLEPIHPAVYIAPESTLFLIPPLDARLGDPTTLDVVVLNAGTRALHARGQVTLSLPGMPHLDTTFDVDARVEAGGVETVTLDWTPPAAGPWQASVHHDLGRREPQVEQIRVAGPVSGVDFQVPAPLLERGGAVTVSAVLTASQDLNVEGLFLTLPRAPRGGVISIDDLFDVQSVQATTLESNTPTTVELDLTPKATGQYELYLVVETPEGPSLHDVGMVTVTGSTGGWPVAWSPTLLVGALVGLHVAWRRWWVA